MDDAVRRWLELQRDLGGDEVIFNAPLSRHGDDGAPVADRHAGRPAKAPVPDASSAAAPEAPLVARQYPPGEEPAWAKGAPPIPRYGLSVTTPSPVLLDPIQGLDSLDAVAGVVSGCTRCPLCKGRTKAVPGEGNPSAGLMVVGEGPGEQEDLSGRPFVGRAGELLDKILESIETPRGEVFIANVVKCRPPRNRAPLPDERAACLPYLQRQIALVRPRVILALGATAAEALLGVKKPLGELRTRVHRLDGTPLVVSYHPAALLRNPNWKRPAWDDVRIARQLLDLDR